MSHIIDTKLAGYQEELTKATERLGQIQNAERQTTQQIIALKGAIEALEETNKELATADQETATAECELPQ